MSKLKLLAAALRPSVWLSANQNPVLYSARQKGQPPPPLTLDLNSTDFY